MNSILAYGEQVIRDLLYDKAQGNKAFVTVSYPLADN